MYVYVCGEVCEEPWHVGTHVDSANASQTLPLPNHSHTQAITSREAPLQDIQGAVPIASSHSVKSWRPPGEGDPEAGDKVRKRHPHTHSHTACALNLPQVTPSPVGKAALRSGGLGSGQQKDRKLCRDLGETCSQMAQGWGPGFI